MNKIERKFYDLLKNTPWLKFAVRNIYQGLYDLLPRKKEFAVNPIDYKEGYFFGFHDINPFSLDNEKVLANKLPFDLKMPTKTDVLKIGYFDFSTKQLGEFIEVDKTQSWNYHKGCRLQWRNDNQIIFNTVVKNKVTAKIVDIYSQERTLLNQPIDSVSQDGCYASTFSYERLEKFMPGYGYAIGDNHSYLESNAPQETGIHIFNLDTGKEIWLMSLKELAECDHAADFSDEYFHFVTHSEFSPDGNYLSFFHRWVGEDTRKRYTRLIIYDLKKKDFFVAPTGDMVSHYVWNENNDIIAYCNFKGVDCHTLFKIPDLDKNFKVAHPRLNSDGHQSFINKQKFITDTYPDKYRMAKLFSVNIDTDEAELLASIYSPKKFQTKSFNKHIACDLHPRVSRDGNYVCFDTARTGKRALAVMKLNK